jgi:membrane peptidoglycan carboxypeptidase
MGLSVTLGGGEVKLLDLVSAYSAFANGGDKIKPVAILKVADSNGKVLFQHHQVKGQQVVSPQEAFLINNILSDNTARLLTFGVNSLLNMGTRPVAVKTGTTNDRRDNWAIGWSRSVVVGAWVGNNDNAPMKEVASGVSGASPIWRRLMLEALTSYPSENFETPPGIVSREVDIISGYIAHDGFPSRQEYFIEQSILDGQDPVHVKIQVCKSDGKKAGPVEIAKGDTEEREFIILKAPDELPEADRKKWQEGIDAWIAGQGDNRYKPPTEQCGTSDEAVIKVKQPQDQTKINNNSFDWEVEVVTNKKVDKVEVFVDGQTRQALTSFPWKSTLNLVNGSYKLKFKATLEGAKEFESGEVKIGINQDWNQSPSPTPTLTATLTPTITP